MKLSILIKNFKSIEKTRVNLQSGLNILVGPNASGKTCILSSLKFVRDLFLYGVAQAMARNGGAKRVYRREEDIISFSINHDYEERIYRRKKITCRMVWEIRIGQTGAGGIANIIYERIRIYAKVKNIQKTLFRQVIDRRKERTVRSSYYLCEPEEYGRDLFSIWDEYYSTVNKEKIYEDFSSNFRELSKVARNNSDISIFPTITNLDQNLRNLYSLFLYLDEYSIVPDIARQSTEQLPFAQMRPNGEGVSEVIDALEKKNLERIQLGRYYGRGEYRTYETEMRGFRIYPYYYSRRRYLPYHMTIDEDKRLLNALENINKELSRAVKPINSINIETDQTNGRRFVVFNAGKYKFYPEEVSDGTIKWLCILVSIYVPYSTVYILEEPENFLHPWMQQRLIDMMREHAKVNKTIFILSTHSTSVLNCVLPEEVLIVSATEKGTKINIIQNKEEIKLALDESGFRLGDYWVSGALGGVP